MEAQIHLMRGYKNATLSSASSKIAAAAVENGSCFGYSLYNLESSQKEHY